MKQKANPFEDDDPTPVRKCTKAKPRPDTGTCFAHPIKQIAEINYGYHAYKCPHCGQQWEECYDYGEDDGY